MAKYLARWRFIAGVALSVVLVFSVYACKVVPEAPEKTADSAAAILEKSGVKGGLVVVIGWDDPGLLADIRGAGPYMVSGLEGDPEKITAARTMLREKKLYGPVAVSQIAGSQLPFVDNLVNLVVSKNLGAVPMAEVMRVLAPNGVAYVDNVKTVKPRPKEIDEWTHYLHDPSNNAVAHDTIVGPPRRMQWVGSPRWARHHDRMASLSSLVSSAGRLFYVIDEGSHASIQLPSKWRLVARDAFSGCVLWKREIDRWHPRLWPFKSGPAQPQRRLVSVGNTVYATLSLDAPLTAMDAATGKTLRTYGNYPCHRGSHR